MTFSNTHYLSSQILLIQILWPGNCIGNQGTTSLSELLKMNTTLTALNLRGKYKTLQWQLSIIHFVIIQSTGNDIEETGATALGESLKVNTTLTIIYLEREHKVSIEILASLSPLHMKQTIRLEMKEQKRWANLWKWITHWHHLTLVVRERKMIGIKQ